MDLFGFRRLIRLLLPGGKFDWLTNFRLLNGEPSRILCIVAEGLGDTIMDAPSVDTLKRRFPNSRVSVLLHKNKGSDRICALMPSVDETIDVGLESFRLSSVVRFMMRRFWKLIFCLRRKKFDLAVVFWPNPLRRLILIACGAKYRIYGNMIDDYPPRQNEKLLRLVGIEQVERRPIFNVGRPENAEQILPQALPRPWIGVNPFCGMQWRQWDKFEQLQMRLCGLPGSVIIVGRQPGYTTRCESAVNLVNKLTVGELFWVIRQMDAFVTADSGPMHIALAMETPMVALFGSVKPSLRLSEKQMASNMVFYKSSGESEKNVHITIRNKSTGGIENISVDEVFDAVKQMLSKCYKRSFCE